MIELEHELELPISRSEVPDWFLVPEAGLKAYRLFDIAWKNALSR